MFLLLVLKDYKHQDLKNTSTYELQRSAIKYGHVII